MMGNTTAADKSLLRFWFQLRHLRNSSDFPSSNRDLIITAGFFSANCWRAGEAVGSFYPGGVRGEVPGLRPATGRIIYYINLVTQDGTAQNRTQTETKSHQQAGQGQTLMERRIINRSAQYWEERISYIRNMQRVKKWLYVEREPGHRGGLLCDTNIPNCQDYIMTNLMSSLVVGL